MGYDGLSSGVPEFVPPLGPFPGVLVAMLGKGVKSVELVNVGEQLRGTSALLPGPSKVIG